MDESKFQVIFDGGMASRGMLSLYDASVSNYGLARTLAIIGHYYSTGEIISHAPRSSAEIYIGVAEDGSFKQTVIAATVAGIVAAPFGIFASRVFEDWIPKSTDPQLTKIIELLEEQNRHLRELKGLPANRTPAEKQAINEVDAIVGQRNKDLQILRSVTSNSFKGIFRPIGRSAKTTTLTFGPYEKPIRIADSNVVAMIESEQMDKETTTLDGVVNSFSRSSKTGVMFSEDIGRGFRFQFEHPERLNREDVFSWSQYSGKKIRITGRFVRFYDGTIKKLLIYHAEIIPDTDQ